MRLGSFLYLARAQAPRADTNPFRGTVHIYLDALDVGLCGPLCFYIRVAHQVARHRALSADFTFICHDQPPFFQP